MPAAPATPSPAASDRSDPALRALLLSLGAAVFIVNLDSRAVAPLLPAIASELGLSIGRVGLLVSSYLLPYGARMLPLLVRRAGEGALLVSGGSLMAGGYLLAALAPVWALVGAACLMTGLGFTLCHSTLQTRATEAFPQARGTAVSLFAFSLFAGSGAGALLYAGAIDRFGYAAVFGAAGALLGVYTAVTARALRRRVAAAPAPAAPAAPDPA